MSKYEYNMVVIGGGSAGLVTSYISAAIKSKVALIEKHKMGGDCLNTGCVPSKALIRSTKMLAYAKRHKEFGFKSQEVDFDFSDVMDRVQRVIKTVEPHDSIERYSSLGVDCIQGSAKILEPHSVEVNDRLLTTRNITIATGAGPLIPSIPGLDQIRSLHTDNLWEIRELPKKLAVLGGGPIGSELAQCFARLGSQVTQVEMAPSILGREDPEISQMVINSFQNDGIRIMTSSKAVRIEPGHAEHILVVEREGQEEKITFDQILVAVGRKANIAGFGAAEVGIEITERGTVKVDDYLRTSIPNIYACGDVAGPYQFTHTAAHQAWYCAVNAHFEPFKKFKVDYSVIPWCTYTDPEIAQVGINETTAKQQGIPHDVTTYGIDELDRAIADEEAHGIVKIITEPGRDKILGVTICGHHAGDLIAEYVLAMKHGLGLNKILGTIHIYPTLAEANKYAAGIWKKSHAPEGLLNLVKKFHSWRR